ncbi:MAG: diguanylate cyclase, partial [Clostridia bacterium]|nr:diguanylate cyclase [Clostridia bacterium]
MTYSSVGILALILHLIVNHDVLLQNSSSETIPARQQYRAFLISVAAFFITDLLWGVLYDAQLVQLNYLDTVVYFVAMACSILFWTRFVVGYLDEVNWLGKALLLGGRLIFLFGIVMLGVNLIRPVMFAFDPDGTYHAGEARYVVLITQIGIFFLTGIYALATSAKREGTMRRRYRTIALSSVSMGIFIAMQTYYPLLPLYTVGCLLSGCVLHSFVLENEKDEYRDDMEKQLRENIRKGNYYDMLTGLPSMTHFFDLADARKEAILESGGCPVLLYMDFSGMKFYNTQHGFSAGDMLLLDFARILVGTFSNENCCRIGADHFAVIAEQEGIEDRLNEIFHEWKNNEGGSSLPVHVGIYVFRNENKHVSIACDRAKLACFEL